MPIDEPFEYTLLRPLRAPGAAAHNAPLLGPATLGVEVTEPELARRCGLGSIDPQHGAVRGAGAAIEAALDWPPPPLGSRLVTLRPDADALGAMAVLSLRARGAELGQAAEDRIAFAGRWDGFAQGSWREFVRARGPLPRPASAEDVRLFPLEYAALASIAADAARPLTRRVALIRRWLLTGQIPPAARAAAGASAEALARAWSEGALSITRAPDAPLAIVIGAALGGLALAYRFAPVVVADQADAAARKVTIAQYEVGHADLSGLAAALGRMEPGWGGSATIIGSPQGAGTRLPLEIIERETRARLFPDSGAFQDG